MKPITFVSNLGNNYLYSPYKKTFVPIDSKTKTCIDTSGLYDITPLYNKLLNADYLKEKTNSFIRYISKEDIRKSLANLNQVVFEVTTSCDLRCKYCCYGEGYSMFKNRGSGNLTFGIAKKALDYIVSSLQSPYNGSVDTKLAISFYGGEPLLNVSLISQIVDYSKKIIFKGRRIRYSMTTNALHLAENMDFLANNKFRILVSLDGAKKNNRYRVYPSNKESFEDVVSNLKKVRDRYPKWFETFRFNCVYTDISDIHEIVAFFRSEFNKIPTFSPLHASENKSLEFINSMRKRIEIPHDMERDQEIASVNPMVKKVYNFIRRNSHNFYVTEHNVNTMDLKSRILTGTCIPFSKKIFVDYKGCLYPCEKVSRNKPLGYIDSNVNICFDEIAERFNSQLSRMSNTCHNCYMQSMCTYCASERGCKCEDFCDNERFKKLLIEIISYIEMHPQIIRKVEKHLILR